VQDTADNLCEAENRVEQLSRNRKQMEGEMDSLKNNVQDLQTTVKKQVHRHTLTNQRDYSNPPSNRQ